MIGAEPHAELAQRAARLLRQILHVVGDLRALEHAERLGDLKGDAARDAIEALALLKFGERAEQLGHVLGEPEVEAALDQLERGGR